jgi:NitT/TauT family transport system substrate-binding protein
MRPQARRLAAVLRRSAMRVSGTLLAGALAAAALAVPSRAAETLRVGKAVGVAFSFVPLDIGVRRGLFAQNGLDIESTTFGGDARMQQAMAADSIDVALGSGPAMAFVTKDAPIKGIAAMAGPPLLLSLVVRSDGPKSVAELKGKTVSVSSAGSLTYWLVSETSRLQGWGPDGINIATLGAPQAQYVALAAA